MGMRECSQEISQEIIKSMPIIAEMNECESNNESNVNLMWILWIITEPHVNYYLIIMNYYEIWK